MDLTEPTAHPVIPTTAASMSSQPAAGPAAGNGTPGNGGQGNGGQCNGGLGADGQGSNGTIPGRDTAAPEGTDNSTDHGHQLSPAPEPQFSAPRAALP